MTTLTGHDAIRYAETNGLTLNKYADPTESAREGLTVEQAREIAKEDPSLVWIEASAAAEWDAEGYWNIVIGRTASVCVSEFNLVADEKSLSDWLHEAEHEAWRASGEKGPQPKKWDSFHGPALERLLTAAREAS